MSATVNCAGTCSSYSSNWRSAGWRGRLCCRWRLPILPNIYTVRWLGAYCDAARQVSANVYAEVKGLASDISFTSWTTLAHSAACSEQNTAYALLFTSFSAQFLVHFLSNGVDRGLRVRVITAAAVQLWCLLVCLLVTSWPPLCDESTAWRVDRVTSWPYDELTGSPRNLSIQRNGNGYLLHSSPSRVGRFKSGWFKSVI